MADIYGQIQFSDDWWMVTRDDTPGVFECGQLFNEGWCRECQAWLCGVWKWLSEWSAQDTPT